MGIPGAKKGDKVVGVDTHIIMVSTPGGPVPTPLPHPFNGMIDGNLSSDVSIDGQPAATVGSTATNVPSHIPCGPGPFQKPPRNKAEVFMGSNSVFINGKPAARLGDTAKTCNDPTDMPVGTVVVPMSTVFVGGAPTKAGTGGSSASGSGGGAAAPVAAGEAEAHFLGVKFVDKGGFPITGVQYSIKSPDGRVSEGTLTGDIRRDGVPEGDYEIKLKAITKAEWSKKEARDGETVEMLVETAGIEDGTKAIFEVYEKDFGRADRMVTVVTDSAVTGDSVEGEWTYGYKKDEEDVEVGGGVARYSSPQYYFIVKIEGTWARSGMLDYKDWIEISLEDEDGNPMAGEEYVLYLPNGEIRKGKLDSNGYKKEKNIPPKNCRVHFPKAGEVLMLD